MGKSASPTTSPGSPTGSEVGRGSSTNRNRSGSSIARRPAAGSSWTGAPYEFATLEDLLDRASVDVKHAWTAQPETDVDPGDVPFDVETHGGATLVYRTDERDVQVTYERASGTHGEERRVTEIEGTKGSIRWDWTEVGTSTVTLATDDGGDLIEESIEVSPSDDLGPHQRPLVYFDRVVRGGDAPIRTGAEAISSLATISAIYDCVESGEPRRVDLSDVV